MKIIINQKIRNKLYKVIKTCCNKEIKGACFARYLGNEIYEIEDIFVSHFMGTETFSVLYIDEDYIEFENNYFRSHDFDYKNHNYIGDWHTHPLFECTPSNYDIEEVITELKNSNANFLVQIILKIKDEKLIGNCFLYNKFNNAIKCELIIKD